MFSTSPTQQNHAAQSPSRRTMAHEDVSRRAEVAYRQGDLATAARLYAFADFINEQTDEEWDALD